MIEPACILFAREADDLVRRACEALDDLPDTCLARLGYRRDAYARAMTINDVLRLVKCAELDHAARDAQWKKRNEQGHDGGTNG